MSSGSRPVSDLCATPNKNHERESLNELISFIYDGVFDQSRRESAFIKIARYVGGTGAGLFTKDHESDYVQILGLFGVVPPLPGTLLAQLCPALARHFLGEREQPLATSDLMPFDQLTSTESYRKWAAPLGLIEFVSVVLDKSAVGAMMFGVYRHEQDGFADDDARRRLRLLAPHLRSAMLIVRTFNRKAAEAATLADTLDGLSAGLCLVDAGGRIVHVNAAAQAILDAGDVLRSVEGRLAARDAQADRTLREVFAAAGQGDEALGTKGIAVPLTGEDGERYVAHALPLTSGARQSAGITHTAAAALFIRNTTPAVSARPEVIGAAFKLTPTELRVLLAIVELGSAPEVAAALGIAGTTVRWHVGRLFEKTGAKRQADPVKLVTGYATPLAD
jgi:DNA-binding CsgD family transcriptional regulator/PAS domain-containing protein